MNIGHRISAEVVSTADVDLNSKQLENRKKHAISLLAIRFWHLNIPFSLFFHKLTNETGFITIQQHVKELLGQNDPKMNLEIMECLQKELCSEVLFKKFLTYEKKAENIV